MLAGQREAAAIVADMQQLLILAGISRIDYVAIADPDTLALRDDVSPPAVALVAAHVGETRLIDNCLLDVGQRASDLLLHSA